MAFNNLSDIIYEAITEEYGWGKYGDFKVLIRKKDGYVNATKLCRDGGKELFSWTRLDSSDKLIRKCEEVIQIGRASLLEIYQNGKHRQLSGTYVHQDLVPHIASWISPSFAIKVSRIVNDLVIREYKEELRRTKGEVSQLERNVAELKEINLEMSRKLDLANENIIEAVRGVAVANRNIRGVQGTLNTTAGHSVPPEHIHKKDLETYAIYFCEPNMYVQCRARPFHLSNRERELRDKYPGFRVAVTISPVPNARTLASEFERRIRERGATFNLRQQSITLPPAGLTEEEMTEIAREVFEERNNSAAAAEEKYVSIDMNIDQEGKIVIHETVEELFTDLLKKSLLELKDIARAFPRDLKTYGGWSGKPKTELAKWILLRRGHEFD